MDETNPEAHEPERHSPKPGWLIPVLIGLVCAAALFIGVMAWYFTGVDPGGGPPGLKGSAKPFPPMPGTEKREKQ